MNNNFLLWFWRRNVASLISVDEPLPEIVAVLSPDCRPKTACTRRFSARFSLSSISDPLSPYLSSPFSRVSLFSFHFVKIRRITPISRKCTDAEVKVREEQIALDRLRIENRNGRHAYSPEISPYRGHV